MVDLKEFANPVDLASRLASDTATTLDHRVSRSGQASLVVSGGATPREFFARLARMEIDWAAVTVTLADERWIDPRETASNEHLVRTTLLKDRAAAANFIPLKNMAETAREGETQCCRNLANIPRPFSLVVLGMGADGHTASLFPGSPQLSRALNPDNDQICMAVTPGQAPHERMTMTLAALLDTDQIILHITGRKKRDVLERALAGGPHTEVPIRAVLHQDRCPVQVYWAP